MRSLCVADSELVKYLKAGVEAGHPVDSLKKALIGQGWDKSMVEAAAEGIGAPQKSAGDAGKTETKEPGKRPVGITLLSLLGFIASSLTVLAGLVILAGSFMLRDALTLIILPIISELLLPLGIEAGTFLSGGLMVAALVFVAVLVLGFGIFLFWACKKLWNMQKTGWISIVGVSALSTAQQALSSERNYVTIGIYTAVLAYLFLKRNLFR